MSFKYWGEFTLGCLTKGVRNAVFSAIALFSFTGGGCTGLENIYRDSNFHRLNNEMFGKRIPFGRNYGNSLEHFSSGDFSVGSYEKGFDYKIDKEVNDTKRFFRGWIRKEYVKPFVFDLSKKLERNFMEIGFDDRTFYKNDGGVFNFLEEYVDFKIKLNDPYAIFKISKKMNNLGGFEIGGTIDTNGEKELFANLINCR